MHNRIKKYPQYLNFVKRFSRLFDNIYLFISTKQKVLFKCSLSIKTAEWFSKYKTIIPNIKLVYLLQVTSFMKFSSIYVELLWYHCALTFWFIIISNHDLMMININSVNFIENSYLILNLIGQEIISRASSLLLWKRLIGFITCFVYRLKFIGWNHLKSN